MYSVRKPFLMSDECILNLRKVYFLEALDSSTRRDMPINTCVSSDERRQAVFEGMVRTSHLCAAIPMLSDTGCLCSQGTCTLFVQ